MKFFGFTAHEDAVLARNAMSGVGVNLLVNCVGSLGFHICFRWGHSPGRRSRVAGPSLVLAWHRRRRRAAAEPQRKQMWNPKDCAINSLRSCRSRVAILRHERAPRAKRRVEFERRRVWRLAILREGFVFTSAGLRIRSSRSDDARRGKASDVRRRRRRVGECARRK